MLRLVLLVVLDHGAGAAVPDQDQHPRFVVQTGQQAAGVGLELPVIPSPFIRYYLVSGFRRTPWSVAGFARPQFRPLGAGLT